MNTTERTQERITGALKGFANGALGVLSFMGAPRANLDQIRNFFHLESTIHRE